MGTFTKNTTITFTARVLNLILGIGTSIVIARFLGPEGKGIYTLAVLLPTLIVTLGNLGIGPATAYYVARREYHRHEILGNNVILAFGVGAVGLLVGLIVVLFFRRNLFPGVAQGYLLLALALIPTGFLFTYLQNILLGAQRFKEYNFISILQGASFLAFIVIALWVLKIGVVGALLAGIAEWFLVDVILFLWTKRVAGGISLKFNPVYLKKALTYGVKAYLGNALQFLNYRLDMFLVNGFLNPAAVGFYSIGVGIAEKLWMVSQAASTVLFPRVAGETDEQRRKEFTPLIARTVLWVTAFGALVLALLSRWIILLLYSATFLPAVGALQALLVGIIALSAGRVLSNDIAGRGRPMLNTYVAMLTLVANVSLNLVWIPKYGITGAAWASTISYTASFLSALFFYCRLSGNRWTVIVFPQRGDWALYWKVGKALCQWALAKARGML